MSSKIVQKYKYQTYPTNKVNNLRYYCLSEDLNVPSVTSIIRASKANHHRTIQNKITSPMEVGDMMHKYLQQYLTDAPDTIDSADFDIDNNGLNSSESDNYADALRQYSDDVDEYLNQLDEHNDLMNTYTGKSVFWSNISSAFIVGGLVCLTFSTKAVEMSNAIRLTLVIGTIYMLAGMLGYDMPGVDAAVGFGFGGD